MRALAIDGSDMVALLNELPTRASWNATATRPTGAAT